MAPSFIRFKRIPTRTKCYAVIGICLSLYLCYYVFYNVLNNHLTEEDFLETRKCPACFGMSLCYNLFNGDSKLTGASKLRFLDSLNLKNIYYGVYREHDVVFKKLAHNQELRELDEHICRDAHRPQHCDVAKVVHLASYYKRTSDELHLTVNLTRGLSEFLTCPTARLLNRIKRLYKERSAPDRLLYRDKIMLLTTLRLNPEPIVIQTFPEVEGWPFPKYFGACGRFTVQSNAGKTLENFYHAPFHQRLDIAYQILKMADHLSENEYQFALYWTDLQYENFAIDKTGKVTFIDVENIIVVDKLTIKKEKRPGWDKYHQSSNQDCSHHGTDCLSYSPDALCTHADSDHNYYMACYSVLAPRNEEGDQYPGGLLHDMPDSAKDDWELETLLRECAYPSRLKGRQHAKDKLLFALNKLRIIHLDEHPEKYSGHFDE